MNVMQDDEKDIVVDDEIHQRINELKQRRRNDRINQILSAAAEGDLTAMKAALKVQSANFIFVHQMVDTD
jgi:hypothetical protein